MRPGELSLLVEQREIGDLSRLAEERQAFAGAGWNINLGVDPGEVGINAEAVERRRQEAEGLIDVELDALDRRRSRHSAGS